MSGFRTDGRARCTDEMQTRLTPEAELAACLPACLPRRRFGFVNFASLAKVSGGTSNLPSLASNPCLERPFGFVTIRRPYPARVCLQAFFPATNRFPGRGLSIRSLSVLDDSRRLGDLWCRFRRFLSGGYFLGQVSVGTALGSVVDRRVRGSTGLLSLELSVMGPRSVSHKTHLRL